MEILDWVLIHARLAVIHTKSDRENEGLTKSDSWQLLSLTGKGGRREPAPQKPCN